METEKIISFFKTNWLKITIGIVVVVVVYIVVKKAIDKIRSNADNREAHNEYLSLINDLENNSNKPRQLTDARALSIAERIHTALRIDWGWSPSMWIGGTDEQELKAAIKSIPTAIDYFVVKDKYLGKYGTDMWSDISSDLTTDGSDPDYNAIDSHLNLISVAEGLR